MQSQDHFPGTEENLTTRIQTTLRRSVSRKLWKRILWRIGLVIFGFIIVGSFLLESLRYYFPQLNEMPFVIFVTVNFLLYPLIIISVRHVLALLVDLQMAHVELLVLLGKAVAKRDQDTGEHNFRVAIMAVQLAEAAQLDSKLMMGLFMGAFLHDIGKIGVPDSILLKPNHLSHDERLEIEKHVAHGLEIVTGPEWLQGTTRVVGFHHEKFDGSGYPNQKKGAEIPIEARIFSIIDVFDALVSIRPYKDALPFEEALAIIVMEKGKSFDPILLDVFMPIAKNLYNQVIQSDLEQQKEMVVKIIEKYFSQWETEIA